MGGEISVGKTQVKLEKNQVTVATRKRTTVDEHAGGGRCLIRIETLILWFSWKETANDFGPLRILFRWERVKRTLGERLRGNGEMESKI